MEIEYITNPTITLVGQTEVTLEGMGKMQEFYGDAVQDRDYAPGGGELIEFAGRKCYDADGRKNAKTATSYGYIGNILDQKHESVLEHVNFTFLVEGISRAASHEWVRHRHGSYSQESQRFVLATKKPTAVIPPALMNDSVQLDEFIGSLEPAWELYESTYQKLRDQGVGRKQASEAARSYIPNAAATDLVVTGNVRYWKEFIEKRDAAGADAEIRRAAKIIAGILADALPEVFGPRARNKHWSGDAEQKAMK